MPNVTAKNFPGVYTNIQDQSFLPQPTSRFSAGLIGVASKGPVNTPTQVQSLKDFRRKFGKSLGAGTYLADAAAILCDLTDGLFIERIAHHYTPVDHCAASGTKGAYKLYSPKANVFNPVNFDNDASTNVYLRVTQVGLPSTVNAVVSAIGSDGGGSFITLRSSTGDPALAASYTSADIAYSELPGAASNAESVIYAYPYKTLALTGTVTGDKNAFQVTYTGSAADWTVGAVYKIVQANHVTTYEVRVKSILVDSPVIVQFETVSNSQYGYQGLPLQDSYAGASVYQIDTAAQKLPALYLAAATPGTWANGAAPSTGLYVKVLPGSKAGTKKLEVYEDSALVESFDSLTDADSTAANFYETAINSISSYIVVKVVGNGPPANTAQAWDATLTTSSTPKSMPLGPINDGETGGTHGSFANGFDGATITDADIVGTIDPSDDSASGIKAFEATDQQEVDFLCAPGIQNGDISVAVMQEMCRVANLINAEALMDVPRGLNLREATDWHNGEGLFKTRGKLDTRNGAVYWNWFTSTDRWSIDPTATKALPPSIAALRCEAAVFDNVKPWRAAAGEINGFIPEALSIDFTKVSADSKEASYGNGNSINAILLQRGRIMLFGERTLQRLESKLSVVHSNVLVHYIVKNMAEIARRFVFEPNDAELLTQLNLVFTEFLDTIKNERGIEDYNLVIDKSNNTADTRNRREVNVDLFVIPTDTVERIFINAIVRQSGAELKNASA